VGVAAGLLDVCAGVDAVVAVLSVADERALEGREPGLERGGVHGRLVLHHDEVVVAAIDLEVAVVGGRERRHEHLEAGPVRGR
jgi:hypothetical protein